MNKKTLDKAKAFLGWAFGILVGLSGLSLLFSQTVPALALLLMSAILIPPVLKWIEERLNFKLSITVKIITLVIAFFLVGFTVDSTEETDKGSLENSQPEEVVELEEVIESEPSEPQNIEYNGHVVTPRCQEICLDEWTEINFDSGWSLEACHILCEEGIVTGNEGLERQGVAEEGQQEEELGEDEWVEADESRQDEGQQTEEQDLAEVEAVAEIERAETPKAEANASEPTPAFKIASLHDGFNPPTDSTLAQFETLLTSLEKKCPNESQEEISGYIFVAQEKFVEKGVFMSYLEVAEGIDGSIPEGMDLGLSCAEVAAAFFTLVTGQ